MSQTKNTLTPPPALIKRASYDMCVLEGAVSWNAGKGVNGGAVTGKRKRRKFKKKEKKKSSPERKKLQKESPAGKARICACVRLRRGGAEGLIQPTGLSRKVK